MQARAGVLGNAWTATSKPSTGDISQFLTDVAAEIDGYLGGRGLAAPALGTPAANALRNVNALGALLIALEATYPESSGPASASETIASVREQYQATIDMIVKGTHPAVWLLQEGNVASKATSFWEQEPNYGLYPLDPRLTFSGPDFNQFTAPAFARGQSF